MQKSEHIYKDLKRRIRFDWYTEEEKAFTYESKPLKMKSRIDYFLIAKSISRLVSPVNVKISIAPDHRAVT